MKKTPPRQLTWLPQRAIREHCLWCCENRKHEVEACASVSCPLYPLRSLQAAARCDDLYSVIRRKCLDCVTGSRTEVRNCTSVRCPLWKFRLGKESCNTAEPR